MVRSKNTSLNGDSEPSSFEDSFHRLTEMAEELESGGLTLSEATSRFEEGMNLVQYCNELLNNAELKITELKDAHRLAGAQQGPDDRDDDSEDDSDA